MTSDRHVLRALADAAGLSVEDYLRQALDDFSRPEESPLADQHRPEDRREPTHTTSALYRKLESAGGVKRIVDQLYERVTCDDVLLGYFKHLGTSPYLDDPAWKWLKWHLTTFLVTVTGGPQRYQGRDIREAHADLRITDVAFDHLTTHLDMTLRNLYTDDVTRLQVLRGVEQVRSQVVTFDDYQGIRPWYES